MSLPAPSRRGFRSLKAQATREKLAGTVVELIYAGVVINHDTVAARSGCARRTVYRYYANQDALLEGGWDLIISRMSGMGSFPKTPEDLEFTLEPIFTNFDQSAAIVTVLRSTLRGRQVRLSDNEARVKHYTAAVAPAVTALPLEDQKLVTALLQVLHTTPWLEMRDLWGLDGKQSARVTRWAISTLLFDLKARGATPISPVRPRPAKVSGWKKTH